MKKDPLAVVVVDGHDVHRAGLAAILNRQPDMRVVSTVRTAWEAIQFLETNYCDVVVTEAKLRDRSGASFCRVVKEMRPQAATVVLTSVVDDTIIHACLSAGVRAYLIKDGSGAQAVEAVRKAAIGESMLAPVVVERIIEWARRASSIHGDVQMLTPHEVLALSLAAQGLSTRQMASRMRIGTTSLKQIMKSAMKKLGTNQRAEAVAAGIRRGVI